LIVLLISIILKYLFFSGKLDSVINQGVSEKLKSYYTYFVDKKNIITQFNISCEHAFITKDYGSQCKVLGSPYINNCNFDLAGTMLQHFYADLISPVNNYSINNIFSIDQTQFVPFPYTAVGSSLSNTAYLYIPSMCQKKKNCQVHIALHGCKQTVNDIGNVFYTKSGYNEWAEANNIIIIYPQVISSVLNPEGCWDWFGYTGMNYATKYAPQMATIFNMMKYVIKTYSTDF